MDKISCFLILICLTVSWGLRVEAKSSDLDVLDPAIRVPDGHNVKHEIFAVGYQIYRYNGSAWVSHNVSADLFDFKARKIGRHYFLKEKDSLGGQPTWETFRPWSKVTAAPQVIKPQDGAIPFVLLIATHTEGNTRLFGNVSFVQRLFTRKGLAPTNQAGEIGDTYQSFYTALYTFAKPTHR